MKSNAERQREFKSKQRELGMVQVAVWIPKDKKKEVLEYIDSLKPK